MAKSASAPNRAYSASQQEFDDARATVELLYRTYYTGLCVVVRDYVHSLEAAEEIVQDLFLRVWNILESAGERGAAETITRAYLYTAARNAAVSALRHERVVRQHEHSLTIEWHDARHSQFFSVEEHIATNELTIAARHAIARLPLKCREVFTLSRDRGLTYSEIAQVLGISVKTVEQHMTAAFKSLRASLRKHRE